MTDLRFPNVKDDKEDPALAMARNSLKRKTPETKIKAKSGMATCWRCKEAVGGANLKQKWIRRLNAQRYLCDDCIPYKDEEFKGKPEAVNLPPAKIAIKQPDKSMSVKSEDAEPYLIKKYNTGDFIKFKECFKCDSNLFYVIKGGVVCQNCGTEYQL